MRKNLSNVLWGLIFIGIGIGLIGNIFDLWNYEVFFDGWWTLFLIIPAIISMVQSGVKIGNSVVLCVGVLLLLDQQKIIPNDLVFKAAAPAILILIGIIILSKALVNKPNVTTPTKVSPSSAINSEDQPNYLAIFSGNTVKNNSKNFLGGTSTALFGGNEIDLSDVVLAGDVDFTVTSIFGGTDIKAPKNARIELRGVPIFGGNENTSVSSADPSAHKIIFHCTSIFGGTEIK